MEPFPDAQVDWTGVDSHLLNGRPVLAIQALRTQRIDLLRAIDFVDQRVAELLEADPESFVVPPPWPEVYT